MEHQWRIEKKDVWAFPLTENQRFYGIRIENTGKGFIEDTPYVGVEPEEFTWAENVDPVEFNARTEEEWLELLEGWLADETSDAAFSLYAATIGSRDLDKDAIMFQRGDWEIFEPCLLAPLLLNEDFMRGAQDQNETSRTGKVFKFGIIIRFDEAGVLNYEMWPGDKNFRASWNHVTEQLQPIIEWFMPRRDEAKIHRYTALRRRIVGEYSPHQIIVEYAPQPLSAHERAEFTVGLNQLFSRFPAQEAETLRRLIFPLSKEQS